MPFGALQLLFVMLLTLSAGLLMVMGGTSKRMLRWRDPRPRCRTCGRTDRYNCACRR